MIVGTNLAPGPLWGEGRAPVTVWEDRAMVDAASPPRGDRRSAVALDVRLFGRVEVRAGEREVRLPGRQAQALVALLALDRRPIPRETIATWLWPDADPGSTASVRQALWLVRTGLAAAGVDPDDVLEVESESIGLCADARVRVDARLFEEHLAARPSRADLAVDLYRGDLTEGLAHECFAAERERLADAYEDALATVAERHLLAGRPGTARAVALRLLARDPLREEAHAVLIGVYGAIGTRSQVHRQYRRLVSILTTELGCEPLPETVAIYRAALEQTVERSGRRAAGAVFAARRAATAYAGRG